MVHKIIPYDFFNIDLEDNQENDKKQLEILRRELEKFKEKKNNQVELKGIRLNSLLVLRQMRGQFTDQEYQEYEGKINVASSREEIEVIVKEFLLKIRQKASSPKPNGKKDRGNSENKPQQSEEEIEHAYQEIRKENTNHPEIQLVNPSVVRTIQEGGEISEDLKKAKYIFFPINNAEIHETADAGNHWTLLVFAGGESGCFFNYNSLGFSVTPDNAMKVVINFHDKANLAA
ncbi:36071_t:CDS:2 [Racocetra persica]|uniref:36071_t:CDS:1 n=1 Tax=Racocetra persica TaxID=160502 RepID=A0ACA9M042_9GLOM|nr:36071_t:CDS:2 [Racocetra persica]